MKFRFCRGILDTSGQALLNAKTGKGLSASLRGHRKYSKRSQKYYAEIVREAKTYSYYPFLICKMLLRRAQIEGSFSQPSDRNEFNPQQTAPRLGRKSPHQLRFY